MFKIIKIKKAIKEDVIEKKSLNWLIKTRRTLDGKITK